MQTSGNYFDSEFRLDRIRMQNNKKIICTLHNREAVTDIRDILYHMWWTDSLREQMSKTAKYVRDFFVRVRKQGKGSRFTIGNKHPTFWSHTWQLSSAKAIIQMSQVISRNSLTRKYMDTARPLPWIWKSNSNKGRRQRVYVQSWHLCINLSDEFPNC